MGYGPHLKGKGMEGEGIYWSEMKVNELISKIHNIEKEIDGLHCALGTTVELLDPRKEDFPGWTDAQKLYVKRLRALLNLRKKILGTSVKVFNYDLRFEIKLGEEA